MYCIDKDGEVAVKLSEEKRVNENKKTISVSKNDTSLKQIDLFSKQIIEKLIKEKIPPTPENYAIYFENLLEEKPLAQRKKIASILEAEAIEKNNYVAEMENNVKKSFQQTKAILNTVASMYTKINKLRSLAKSKKQENARGSGQVAWISFEENLDEVVESLKKQQLSLKERYTDIAESIKIFNQSTIFDPNYDVYNKNYLLNALEAEKKNVVNFEYSSTVVAFKIKKSSFDNVRLARDKELIIKNVVRMIVKRSRRSDIIGHIGDDTFIILLKHTTMDQAYKTIESIQNMISFSNYIVDSQSIDIMLDFGTAQITSHQTREQIISAAINQL